MADIESKAISFYENDRRSVPSEYLLPLAEALNVSVDELCGKKEKEETIVDELAEKIIGVIYTVLRDYDITPKK